jgi:predicted nucleic acid-binding protein
MVLVDTSAWIEAHRTKGSMEAKLAVRGLLDAYEATLCGPVEMEYLGGARPEEVERLKGWCSVIPYLRNDQKIWRKAGDNFAKLRQSGFKIPWNDVLVATLALNEDCRVYSVDKHFPVMASILGLRLYTPGYAGTYRPENEEL